jgi:hypothetical protein
LAAHPVEQGLAIPAEDDVNARMVGEPFESALVAKGESRRWKACGSITLLAGPCG